jgi:hypothetical protein
MKAGERRKEARYVVIGIEAVLNGAPCTIVDISSSAVRLLKPEGASAEATADIAFTMKAQGRFRRRSFRVLATLVRSNEIELIYRYSPPNQQWEEMLRAHDTFVLTQLTSL